MSSLFSVSYCFVSALCIGSEVCSGCQPLSHALFFIVVEKHSGEKPNQEEKKMKYSQCNIMAYYGLPLHLL